MSDAQDAEWPNPNLTCPFCGGPVDPTGWLRNDGVRGPECYNCGASAQSIEQWNTRSDLRLSPETVERIRGSVEYAFISDNVHTKLQEYQILLRDILSEIEQ